MKSTVSRTLLALGLAFSVVGAEPRAEANQSAAAPNPAVEAHYNAGVAAAKKATSKQDWEKVCEEFTQAYALEKNPQIAANLGNAELKAGRMRLAAEHLDYFLQQDKEASKEAKNEIEHLLEQAKKHIVTVKIDVNQVGAKIVIDNVERGMSPLEGPIYLEENEHTFEVRKAGMKAEKQAHVFKKGDKREIRFEMVADGGRTINSKGNQPGKSSQGAEWRNRAFVVSMGISFFGIAMGGGFTTGSIIKDSDVKAEFRRRESELEHDEPMCVPNLAADPLCSRLNDAFTARTNFVKLAIVGYAAGVLGAMGMAIWKSPNSNTKFDNHAKLQLIVTPGELTIKGAF